MKAITADLLALVASGSLLGIKLHANAQNTTKKALPTKMAKATATVTYKAHCGMGYSAADAKKNHYICPMDHKPLVNMPAAGKSATDNKMKMGK
jgi:hypothetical protein